MRRYRRTDIPRPSLEGSIAACAALPVSVSGGERRGRVYRRVCGATRGLAHDVQMLTGLSPRVRRYLSSLPATAALWGSIAACAALPRAEAEQAERSVVYRRVCGATD